MIRESNGLSDVATATSLPSQTNPNFMQSTVLRNWLLALAPLISVWTSDFCNERVPSQWFENSIMTDPCQERLDLNAHFWQETRIEYSLATLCTGLIFWAFDATDSVAREDSQKGNISRSWQVVSIFMIIHRAQLMLPPLGSKLLTISQTLR